MTDSLEVSHIRQTIGAPMEAALPTLTIDDLTSADYVEAIRFWVERINDPDIGVDRPTILKCISGLAAGALACETRDGP
jgi:hypothetical protein